MYSNWGSAEAHEGGRGVYLPGDVFTLLVGDCPWLVGGCECGLSVLHITLGGGLLSSVLHLLVEKEKQQKRKTQPPTRAC